VEKNMLNLNKTERYSLWSTLILGILAHGYLLTNQLFFHDGIEHAFDFGWNTWMISLGRWSTSILLSFFQFLFGMDIVSSVFFNTTLMIFLLAVMSLLIIKILRINDPYLAAAVSGIIVVFPNITSVLGYCFTAYNYALTYFLVTLGVYVITNTKLNSVLKYTIFIISQTFAIGIYQAAIPFMLSIIAVYLIKYSFDEDNISWKNYLGCIFKWAVLCIASMMLYFIVTFSWLEITGIKLAKYQNINNWGVGSVSDYLQRIFLTYRHIVFDRINSSEDMFPMSIRFFYYGILILIAASACVIIIKTFRKSKAKGIQSAVLLLLFPVAVNFIYVMCGKESNIHSLMQFSRIFIFVLLCLLIETAAKYAYINEKKLKFLRLGTLALFGIMGFLYIRLANVCYVKATFIQARAISYFTTLQTRIQSIPGYRAEYPVVFVNDRKKSLSNVEITKQLKVVNILPYNFNDLLSNFAWKRFMNMWVGYSPVIHDAKTIKNPKVLDDMPRYPDDGSIRIIEGKIVVKF